MTESIAKSLLSNGLSIQVPLEGSSMAPALCSGQKIVIRPWQGTAQSLVGKIAAYTISPSRVVVHRVVRVEGERFFPKGDAFSGIDRSVALSSIIGVVDEPPDTFVNALLKALRLKFYLFRRAIPRSLKRRHTRPH